MKKLIIAILKNVVLVPAVVGLVVFVGSYFSILPLKFYIVLSGSMEPAIGTGSVVVVGMKQAFYSPGDIVTFSPKGNNKDFVTHRINTVVDNGVYYSERFRTKGDANKTEDQWEIDSSKIAGRVLFTIPYLGYMANFSKDPKGFILLVIVPATIIIYEELKTVFFELRKSLKKKREQIITPETQAYETREEFRLPKQSVILPIIGALFITFLVTGAFFKDIETVIANSLGIALSYDDNSSALDTSGQVVVNEFSSDGTHSGEWVELFNPALSSIDVSGWKIFDNNSDDDLPENSVIPAGGYAVIIANNSSVTGIPASATKIILEDVQIGNGLRDAGDLLRLKNQSNVTIDELSYGDNITVFSPAPSPAPGAGQSYARIPNGVDTDTKDDWVLSNSPTIGSINL